MSENAEFQLPSADEGMEQLDSLYTEAFFGKMAEFGFTPSNVEEAHSMLETAYHLDEADNGAEKTASAEGVGPYADANFKLKEVLAADGAMDPNYAEQEKFAGIQQASVALAQNSDLYRSVLAVKAAEAAEFDASFAAQAQA